jgi:hypothetical protein
MNSDKISRKGLLIKGGRVLGGAAAGVVLARLPLARAATKSQAARSGVTAAATLAKVRDAYAGDDAKRLIALLDRRVKWFGAGATTPT